MRGTTQGIERRELTARQKDYAGQVFGAWTVIGYHGIKRSGAKGRSHSHYWLCQCECGNQRVVQIASLVAGSSKTCWVCGHGEPGNQKHPLYSTWLGMKGRCANPNHSDWEYYGARGVKVCDEWVASFTAFRDHVGDRPVGMTLDRIDANGHYGPGNVRWATHSQQMLNRRPWSRKAVGEATP